MIKKILFTLLWFLPSILFSQTNSLEYRQELSDNSRKFNEFLYYLTSGYIEEKSPTEATEEAIREVLEKLDPHSQYITKDELKTINESFDGNFEGIGVEFNVLNDTIIVVNPIKGGPSEQVGIKSGDRIIKADGVSVIGTTQAEVPGILRGDKGTEIVLTVKRNGVDEELVFNIIRDKIPMYSVDASYMIDDSIGYVKINRFMSTTTDEFEEAMREIPEAKALILDLRGNSGGFLDQAIRLCDEFLAAGDLIVYTEGRIMPRRDEYAGEEGFFKSGTLVVLVDEESASASEIVSGAIQDQDRGVVIGRPTFGKGLVQQQIPFSDSSAMRLTIAKYFTPSGRAIQRPYKMGDKESYYMDYYKRYTSGELLDHDSDSLIKNMPDSLKRLTLRKGRPVYGGGGITPDIFVGIDTTGYSEYWSKLIRANVIQDYVVKVVDHDRKTLLRKYSKFEQFKEKYEISEEFIEGLMEAGEAKDVVSDRENLEKNIDNVKRQLKALVAQKLWDFDEYYMIIAEGDDILNRAIEYIQEGQ